MTRFLKKSESKKNQDNILTNWKSIFFYELDILRCHEYLHTMG